jgi:hypothetical protein
MEGWDSPIGGGMLVLIGVFSEVLSLISDPPISVQEIEPWDAM